jgi:PAS domain S-box-containing protein
MSTSDKPEDLRGVLIDALDVVADGVIVFDAELRVRYFNRGAERIFGARADDMLGKPLSSLMPPYLIQIHQLRIDDFTASPEVNTRMGEPMQVKIERSDGASLPVEASVTKLARGAQQLFLVSIRDMSHLEANERCRRARSATARS